MRQFLNVGAGPLPQRALKSMKRGRRRQAVLRLHNCALGQVAKRLVVLRIEADIVPGVAQGFKGAVIENGVALWVDGRQDGRGNIDVDAAQRDEGVNRLLSRGFREAATARAERIASLLLPIR